MANSNGADFSLNHYDAEHGRLVINAPSFDYDSFPKLGEYLLSRLSAQAVDKQTDADIHSWLIDFEGCQLMLKAEHYSESIWFEALAAGEAIEELAFLAQLFAQGFN